jgi:hypothetical protein
MKINPQIRKIIIVSGCRLESTDMTSTNTNVDSDNVDNTADESIEDLARTIKQMQRQQQGITCRTQ